MFLRHLTTILLNLHLIYTLFCIFALALAVIVKADILIDESVLAFILDTKSGKFLYHKESNSLITLCIGTFLGLPQTNTGVGCCLLWYRYSRTSCQIN